MHSPEHLSMDEISSPISAEIFELCDTKLFQETLQNSEVASSSSRGYEENSCIRKLSLPSDIDDLNSYQDNNGNNTTSSSTTTSTNATSAATNSNSNLSVIFDSAEELDNDISASINFSPSPSFPVSPFLTTQQDRIDFASLQTDQMPVTDNGVVDPIVPIMGPFASVFEEDCLSSMPSYLPLNPTSSSCSFICSPMGTFMPGAFNAALCADGSGFFPGSVLMGSELQTRELDFKGEDGGIYYSGSMQRGFNPGDLQQALDNETQQLVNGVASSTPLTTEISNLEESSFKVGKLSAEQRKEKIHRYLKKRNERNFSKKIKYACRKTLADSRPRVRGRFAKNDDFGETHRPVCSNHEEDDEEEVVVKGEHMVDSSDIFAHISGANSFKCNYSIQSWI